MSRGVDLYLPRSRAHHRGWHSHPWRPRLERREERNDFSPGPAAQTSAAAHPRGTPPGRLSARWPAANRADRTPGRTAHAGLPSRTKRHRTPGHPCQQRRVNPWLRPGPDRASVVGPVEVAPAPRHPERGVLAFGDRRGVRAVQVGLDDRAIAGRGRTADDPVEVAAADRDPGRGALARLASTIVPLWLLAQ